jgi:hypothetical protein
MVWKKIIRTKAEVVSSTVTFWGATFPKAAYNPAETKAIRMGARLKAYHQGLTRHFSQLVNKRFISGLPPVTPVTTMAARLGVQEAKAISRPKKISDTDVRLTIAPMIMMVIKKNR